MIERSVILERLRERIVRYAAFQLREGYAEDVAQEVLLVLHEKYPALDRVEDLLPVALEVARLKIWAMRRKMRRRGEDVQVPLDSLPVRGSDPDPYEQTERRQRLERLEGALLELGERCRELFRLKLEGYTFPEIRKRLGVESINTLYTWDFRCRKQLLERLGGWEGRVEKVARTGPARTTEQTEKSPASAAPGSVVRASASGEAGRK